jgi:hypothetical protein
MLNLQAPNIEKVLLMIKALNHKTLLLWVSNFLLFHDLWTILFQTLQYIINNKLNFSKCRIQIWPTAPSLVNSMRRFVRERVRTQVTNADLHYWNANFVLLQCVLHYLNSPNATLRSAILQKKFQKKFPQNIFKKKFQKKIQKKNQIMPKLLRM